jgi:hypothetical protein
MENTKDKLEKQQDALIKHIPNIQTPWLKERLETMLEDVRKKIAQLENPTNKLGEENEPEDIRDLPELQIVPVETEEERKRRKQKEDEEACIRDALLKKLSNIKK